MNERGCRYSRLGKEKKNALGSFPLPSFLLLLVCVVWPIIPPASTFVRPSFIASRYWFTSLCSMTQRTSSLNDETDKTKNLFASIIDQLHSSSVLVGSGELEGGGF